NCESFQKFVGAFTEEAEDSANAAAALDRIGLYGIPASARDETEGGLTGAFAVVDMDGPCGLRSVAGGAGMQYESRATFVIHLEGAVPSVVDGDEDSMVWIAGVAGQVTKDLAAQSGL